MSKQSRGSVTQQLRKHWPLAGVVLIYVVLAITYSALTPPYEGPDEPQHFAYVTWLARGKGFPPQGEAAWNTPIEQEAGQTPLYYLLASLPARVIDLERVPAVYRPNPYFPGPASGNQFDNDNRAIHDITAPRPLQGEWLAFYFARLVTLLFGVFLVIGTYLLALQVTAAPPAFALSSAALVALTPQVLFLSSVVSNDIPAAALGTFALVCMAGLIRRAPAAASGLAFASGLLIGLAAMAKINALLLVVPAAVTLLWLWLGAKSAGRQTAESALLMGAGTLLVSGWWFLRGTLLYGSPLGVDTHDYAPWAVVDPQSLASPQARWLEVGRFYWITLGWGTIRPDAWLYGVLLLFTILATIGLALAAYRWRQAPRSGIGAAAAVLLVLAATILANAVLLEVWMNRVIAPYGRLLFTSVAPITIFLILGWRAIHHRFVLLPLLFMAGLAVVTPFYLLRPAFTPPLVSAQAPETLAPALGWRFGTAPDSLLVELIALRPEHDSVAIGDTLAVQLCWRALQQMDRELVFFLQLIGPQNSRVAERHSYPGEGLLLSSQWQPGDLFCDEMYVRPDADWAPTLVYQLEVGVLDEGTGERLTAVDTQGNVLASTFVDHIRVVSPTVTEQAALDESGKAPIQLIDYRIETGPWNPAETYAYELDWAAAMRLEQDYQVFLHLRDSLSGQVVAQADHPPLDGWYPTSWWPVGEVVRDAGHITLPAELPAGSYDLVAGFYDLASLQPLGEEFVLDRIQVQP